MQYKWEKKALKLTAKALNETMPMSFNYAGFGKDHKFEIFAVAVVNHETGEGALIRLHQGTENGIIAADIAQDVLGDAVRMYNEAAAEIFEAP